MKAKKKKIRLANQNIDNKKYLHIFRQSPIATELYDANGKLADANPASLDLFGVEKPDDLANFNLFTDQNLPLQAITDMKAGIAGKYEFVFDFNLAKEKKLFETYKEGKYNVECCINPIIGENKIPTGYIVFVNKITDRKQAEILLEEQVEKLKELNVSKDKFLSIIAHDLRNPFGAIIGFSDLMLKNFTEIDDDTLHKGLKTIESAANQAYKLLENLLIWSRNQTGMYKFTPEVINMKDRIVQALKVAEGSASIKDIKLASDISRNYLVYADQDMIDTVLRNLISNAIKYTRKGGKVKVSAKTNTNNVEITVTDNGVGIPTNKQSEIFQIDKRTNTTGTEKEEGTGLGLIICKDFLARNGGQIWAESTLEMGSKFTFSLPTYENPDIFKD
ncbi:MAG: PAS domain-containing sensor histidine kinase [Bacteroidota bacterium]|nr:PAS domain-containing sensor histidine kinase [Bacteroidota bacterium]